MTKQQPARRGMGTVARYWISWYQPGDDHRPIGYPPPLPILGWWKSGETDEAATLCACVEAESAEDAWRAIQDPQAWPDRGEERFCVVRGTDYVPGDRFPLSDWMKPRFGVTQ